MAPVYATVALLALGALFPLGRARRVGHVSRVEGGSAEAAEVQAAVGEQEPSQSRYDDLVARGCVRTRAANWDQLWKYTKVLTPPEYEGVEHSKDELVLKIWENLDNIATHESMLKGYFKLSQKIKRMRSSNRAKWEAEVKSLKRELRAQGFDYDTALKRCSDGYTDEMYTCLIGKAKELGMDEWSADLVQSRMAAEELLAHASQTESWGSKVVKELKRLKEARRQAIKAEGFSYWYRMKDCKTAVNEGGGTAYMEHAMQELSVTEVDPDSGFCREEAGEMCPEGTRPTTQRRIDKVKGATGAAIGFGAMKGAALTSVAIAGAMSGGAAVAAAGTAAVAFNIAAYPVSAAVGFWRSLGPRECACFLRTCAYDTTTETCGMQYDTAGAPSTNPFGLSLPYAGTKCTMKYKSTNECELQDCSALDYSRTLASGDGSLQGTVGSMDKNVYNCLSTQGGPGSSLSFALKLPSGVNNTVAARNDIYRSLGVEEKADPSTPPEPDANDDDDTP